ncbi:MAG: hypothetical protein ACI9F9_002274, partial [Candidatus Paceibacteria bacterium]
DTDRCLTQAMIHMGLERDARALPVQTAPESTIERFEPTHETDAPPSDPADINLEDLPF